jgi:penicillin-binding protein 1C
MLPRVPLLLKPHPERLQGWWGPALFRALATSLGLGLALTVLAWIPAPPLAAGIGQSQQVLAADGSLLRLTLAADQHYRLWTSLADIAPPVIEAMLLKEDRYFYWHPGVNPFSLLRALFRTYAEGERQGASTITMQLVRRLQRLKTRHIGGKLTQLLQAVWVDLRYSKDEILEAYLNLAPMGGNVEGVAAAALVYFNQPVGQLNIAQALALAVLPQRPAARAGFGPELQAARQRLAAIWLEAHPEDRLKVLAGLDVLGRRRQALPFRAPHLVEHLLAREGDKAVIDTLIAPRLQSLLERHIKRYLGERRGDGLKNANAVLIDRRDMAVRAWVGSADYHDATIEGQVNGVLAKRSTGSTLKPFLYALGIDQGLIHPLSILKDAPTAFGAFRPENFDGRFVGPLAARDALVRSRNLPAVWLATQVQRPSLHGFLKLAGISQLSSEQHYGLALALGGGEASTLELATLYALLANGGELRSPRLTSTDALRPGPQLVSPEAAWLVLDMLRNTPRPDSNPAASTGNPAWPTAWKTGTSWGFRDAWAAGVTGDYVLVVWLGNFDGRGEPALIGATAATPLFLRIADELPRLLSHEHPRWSGAPARLRRIEICTASGELPNRWCPRTSVTWYLPGISPARVSSLHRPVVIDRRSGQAACPPFDPIHTELQVFEFWPSDLARLFTIAGVPRRAPPAPAAACSSAALSGEAADAPRVSSPLAQVTYTLRLSRPDETIALKAVSAAGSADLYWFANQAYVGRSAPDGDLGWRPEHPGNFAITVVDERGRSGERSVEVELVP